MSVKVRFRKDNKILIAGELKEGRDKLEFLKNGDLHVNRAITEIDGYSDVDLIDTERMMDSEHEIDSQQSYVDFLTWFFGLHEIKVSPNKISFRSNGDVLANEILTNQNLGGD